MCDQEKTILGSFSTKNGRRESSHEPKHVEHSRHDERHREPGRGNFEYKEADFPHFPDLNVGKRVEWPSLSDKDKDICLEGQQLTRPSREKQFNRRLCEDEARVEKALAFRRSRSGYLGNLRKHANRLKELMEDLQVSDSVIEDEVKGCNEAFCKFVDAHETCMQYEDDEERRLLMSDSYETQRDLKLQLDILLDQRRARYSAQRSRPPSESGYSKASIRSGRSSRSSGSSRSSVREKKRLEEARLNIEMLKRRQQIDRRMEEVEKGKAELSREIELLEAETQVKQATIDLMMEQYEQDALMQKDISKMDEVSNYLADFDEDSAAVTKESISQHDSAVFVASRPSGGAMSHVDTTYVLASAPVCMTSSHARSTPNTSQYDPVLSSLPTTGSHPDTGLSSQFPPESTAMPCDTTKPKSNTCTTTHSEPNRTVEMKAALCSTTELPLPSTPVLSQNKVASTLQQVRSLPLQPIFSTRQSTMPYAYDRGATPLHAAASEFYPLQSTPCNPPSLQGQSQLEAWTTIAQAIKQGPTLPKIELMKFSGDPLEYAEFVTNFKDNIESQVSDDSQRLTRLLAQCTGKAKDAIRSCVNLPHGKRYKEAWQTLLQNFGQPHMIAEAYMKKLKEIQLRKADAPSLMDFARKLEDAKRVLDNMGLNYSGRLDNEDTIITLMRKLPEESLKRKWADKAGDLIKAKGRAEYKDFVDFVRRAAERINNRYGQELKTSSSATDRKDTRSDKQDHRFKVTTLAAQSDQALSLPPAKCPQCSGPHRIWRCWKFKSSTVNERLKVVKQHSLCRSCLDEGHFTKSCTRGFSCKVDGCGENHHYLLHPSAKETGRNSIPQASVNKEPQATENRSARTSGESGVTRKIQPGSTKGSNSATTAKTEVIEGAEVNRPRVSFKVVPVKVSCQSSDKAITTYAFFDSGSDTSLCLQSLIEELEIKDPKPTKFMMSTVNRQEERSGYKVELNLESLSGDAKFCLENVLTTPSLPVQPKHLASNEEIAKWIHLSDITLPETEQKNITILIGNDRPDIIDNELEKRVGNKGEPFAVKTPFGWTVYGPIEETAENRVHVNLTSTEHKDLERKLELMYDGGFEDARSDEQGMPVEDHRAKEIMDASATLVNGHYQLKLPFKEGQSNLPDSKPTAEKRLQWLKKKMEKDENFKGKYTQVVEKYKTEGSSREVPKEEVAKLKPIWYLPHHAVWHPRKPEEPRVVFDCAAKGQGVSLNDQLLRGPENTSTLIGVILRFRVNDVAVAADIKRMFHQVYVAPEDRGALCYLWWPGGDITKEPTTHQMLVHIFGATSSPSVAGYALRRTAKDNQHQFSSETIDAALRDFYVDDLLKSFADVEQAIYVCKQLQSLLARGGFQLTKWMSNNREVLSAFPEDEHAPAIKNLDLKSECLPTDRALGIHWDVEEDTFKLVVSAREHPENRKGVLSSIATVYDPLGFASPLILIGREINQELCRLKYDWNEALPKDLLVRWKEWKEGLASLKDFKIPRCYTPKSFGEITSAEIHHFADASQEHGYGTASYLRLTNDKDEVHCSFVMGKSRVKPLKSTMTVPKLELTAATLLIRMNNLISKEIQGRLHIDSTTYWTDSMIVLGYIANETKRFPTFVANRVAVIRQASEPSQWKHVRSELNPADYASRGIKACEKEKLERWKRGPEFLWKSKEEWPSQPLDVEEKEDAEEVTAGAAVVQTDFWDSLFHRYSSWNRLRRIVAWTIRIACKLRKMLSHRQEKKNQSRDETLDLKQPLTVSDVEEAEKRIFMIVQRQSYSNEDQGANVTLNAENKGKLARLKPFVEEGLVRVGGRLNRSLLDHDAKHPLILPGKHPVTELMILHCHEKNGHVGAHHVLADIRQRYWIVGGVSSVRRVLSKCHICKRQNAKMGEQITAPLPTIRVSSDEHQLIYPFAAVGLDYFGPMYVKTGPETRASKRNPTLNKRYG